MNDQEQLDLAFARLGRFDGVVTDQTQALERDDTERYDALQSELTDLAHELAGSLEWALKALAGKSAT